MVHRGMLKKVCRLCGNLDNIMYKIYEEEGLVLNLEHYINSYLPIKLTKNDHLPLQICTKCANKLHCWTSFCFMVLEVDRKLKVESLVTASDSKFNISTVNCKSEVVDTTTGYSEMQNEVVDLQPECTQLPIDVVNRCKTNIDCNSDCISTEVGIGPKQGTANLEQPGIFNSSICTIVHTIRPSNETPIPSPIGNITPSDNDKSSKKKIVGDHYPMPLCKQNCRSKFSRGTQFKIRKSARTRNLKLLASKLCACIKIGNPDRYYIQPPKKSRKNEVCRSCFLWSINKNDLLPRSAVSKKSVDST